MRVVISLLLGLTLTPMVWQLAQAQDTALYVVSYIDVAPPTRGTAVSALRQLAVAARKHDGNMRFEILQRMAPTNQFALVAIWKDQKAHDTHMAATHSKDFRDKISPHLISPIDDRAHTAL